MGGIPLGPVLASAISIIYVNHPESKINLNSYLNLFADDAKVHYFFQVVRLSLHDAQLLLDDPRNAGMKVIHLMRDPRGSLNSRWSLYWCLSPECRDSETVCRQQLADLKLVPELEGSYPSRYKFVLYEDLSLRPDKVVRELWRFLNLKPNRRTLALLARNTKTPSTQPYSTLRNSPCHTFSWRKKLNYTMLTKVQEKCKDVIWGLGMRLFASEEEYRNLSVSVMLKEGPSPACMEAELEGAGGGSFVGVAREGQFDLHI
ncbi:carbohydrate sulfotransferase 1-like [Penaeus chinensis]|uniref:carbohydrate sulfotransferase 1-like n=1 Tax=Penaeus chinensis TaxID=139456 RepID=UPI001FB5FDEB|nr:carbohydrate sulfotransferase 1-like [Penaeus chinensis]